MSNNDAHDVGYALRHEYWHQGIMKEAIAAFVLKLEKDGVSFITATHDVYNPYSGKVMESIQMKYCYSYLERWMPKDKIVTFRMYQKNLNDENHPIYRKYWDGSEVHFVEESVDK